MFATFKSLDILQIEFLYENDAFQLTAALVLKSCNDGFGERVER